MLQGVKEAQKVTWSFPCSSAGPSATNPCSRGICLLKDFQCCRAYVLLGYKELTPNHQQLLFFSPQDPFFSLLVGRAQELSSPLTIPSS